MPLTHSKSTGHSLEDELDRYLESHASRVEDRHETVDGRLAELEAEKATLTSLRRRHKALQSA